MGWYGKAVGLCIGGFLGGPFGAGLGDALGDALDSDDPDNSDSEELSDEEQFKLIFFVSFFACLAKMAKADGRVSEEEIAAIESVIKEDIELDEDDRKIAISIFKEAKNSDTTFEEYISQFATLIDYNLEIGTSFLHILYKVAAADGDVSYQEKQLLFQAGQILRVPSGATDELFSNLIILETAYQILGCHPDMTDRQIKAQYHQKCIQFHPDKISDYELAPEFIAFANSQLAKINEAYEQILSSRSKVNV